MYKDFKRISLDLKIVHKLVDMFKLFKKKIACFRFFLRFFFPDRTCVYSTTGGHEKQLNGEVPIEINAKQKG